jgi:protocatechuate 3,4-dioxygenase beta subunit
MKRLRKSVLILGLVVAHIEAASGQVVEYIGDSSRTLSVSGTVFDASGAPAVGVAMDTLPPFSAAREPVLTDTNGKYSIQWQTRPPNSGPVVTPSLIARDVKRNLVATRLLDETTAKADLRLQPGLTISFTVEDPAGNPITNAAAAFYASYANAGLTISTAAAERNASENNRIDINALPQGYHFRGSVRAQGFGVAQLRIPAETHTNRIDLGVVTLKVANLKVAGRILDYNGKGVGNVSIYVSGEGQPSVNAHSDLDGRFSFDACDGPINLTAIAQGGQRGQASVQTRGGDTNVEIKVDVQDMQVNQPNAPRILTVKGTVLDPSGAPDAGAVMATMPNTVAARQPLLSDTNGEYHVEWQTRPGTQLTTLTESVVARDLKRNLVAVHSVDEDTTNLDLHLQPGLTITFKVEDPAGNPVTNLQARLIASDSHASLIISNVPPASDDAGQNRVEFTALPPGFRFSGTVRAPGHGIATLRIPSNESGNRIDLGTVTLNVANLKVAGRILGLAGKAVNQLILTMSGPGQPAISRQTGLDGHFVFDACEGTVTLRATVIGADGSRYTGSVNTTGGDTNVEMKLDPVNVAAPVIQVGPANRVVSPQPPQWLPGG